MLRARCIAGVIVGMLVFAPDLTLRAEEPVNYAALWRSLGSVGHVAYLRGVVDGTFNAYKTAGQEWLGSGYLFVTPEPENVRRVREKVSVGELAPQIPVVITDLYSDPANAYIELIHMVFIARDKIEGKNVEERLQDARKHTLDQHRLREQFKNK